MNTENILVPFVNMASALKALYHSFSLAKRIGAKVFVLFFKNADTGGVQTSSLEKACMEMVNSASEEGMSVSFHIIHDRFQPELIDIIEKEHIAIIVIGAGDTKTESVLKKIRSRITVQIIKVEGKNNINFISV